MSSFLRGVFIVGAKRTPFGAYGGRLKDITSTRLGEISAKAAIEASGVKPESIDSVVVGNVIQISNNAGPYIARHVGLLCGVPTHVPCLTVNRLCGSGFQAVVTAAQDICLRDAEIALAVGSENMSEAPFVMRGSRFGVKFSQVPLVECSLWTTLTDQMPKIPMGLTAENLATKYQITRQECDEYALRSQKLWNKAQESGVFNAEIAPVMVRNPKTKQDEPFSIDEHPKPKSTIEALAKLSSVFKKDGTVTAGNASGVCDGAGAAVLASEDAIKKHNLKPLVRLVGYCAIGCDPSIMGIGPAPAIRKLCDQTGIAVDKVDLIDINEAFAAQVLSVVKELKLDMNKVNLSGGGIALGHPVGASGSRITAHLVHELKRTNGKYAIGTACIGGGQGIAILLENIN